jgi:hypothetical protein
MQGERGLPSYHPLQTAVVGGLDPPSSSGASGQPEGGPTRTHWPELLWPRERLTFVTHASYVACTQHPAFTRWWSRVEKEGRCRRRRELFGGILEQLLRTRECLQMLCPRNAPDEITDT